MLPGPVLKRNILLESVIIADLFGGVNITVVTEVMKVNIGGLGYGFSQKQMPTGSRPWPYAKDGIYLILGNQPWVKTRGLLLIVDKSRTLPGCVNPANVCGVCSV